MEEYNTFFGKQLFSKYNSLKIIKVHLLLVFICFSIFGSDLNAASVSYNGNIFELNEHPRLLINSSNISEIRSRANSNNYVWNILKNKVDDYYRGHPDPSVLKHTLSVSICDVAVSFALMYQIDPVRYAAYGNYAKQILLNYTYPTHYDVSNPPRNPNRDYGSIHLTSLALIYDWIYPLIKDDAAFKSQFITWLNTVMIPMVQQHEQIVAMPPNGYSESNLAVTKWAGEMLIALATYDENPSSESYIQRKLDFWENRLKPLRDKYYQGGHAFDGSHYSYARSLPLLFLGLEAVKTSMNVDYFAGLENRWDKDFISYWLHSMMPDNYHFYSEGILAEDHDFHYGRVLQPFYFSMYKHKDDPVSKYGQFYINQFVKPTEVYGAPGQLAAFYTQYWFLWFDPDAESIDYRNILSKGYFASGVDTFFSRSDWIKTDATHLSFSCYDVVYGDRGDNRQGMNVSSYKIWRDGYLLYENGKGGSGVTNGSDEAQYHNSIILDDGKIIDGWGTTRNTGGLIRKGGVYYNTTQGTIYPKGEITKSDITDYYNYAQGDSTLSYYPTKVKTAIRSIVHTIPEVSSQNDYIIVFDRFETVKGAGLNGAEVVKNSHLWFPTEPVITGNMLTVKSNSGKSELSMRTLLPLNAVITKSIGPNLTNTISDDEPWLVKVRSQSPEEYENFLHVYSPSSGLNNAMPQTILLSQTQNNSSNNIIGTLIQDAVENKIVLFGSSSNSATITSAISYTVETTAKSRHILFDLKPNSNYQVAVDGTTVDESLQANGNGSLSYTFMGTGSYAFSITDSSIQSSRPVLAPDVVEIKEKEEQ